MQKHALKLGKDHMDGLFMDHFQQFMVILYYDMPATNIGMELLQTEAHW